MKRVLFVTPDLNVGGVQRALLALLHSAPLDELDITLRIFSNGGELTEELPSGIKLDFSGDIAAYEKVRASISAFLNKSGLRRIFRFAKGLYHRLGGLLLPQKKNAMADSYDIAVAFSDGLATWYVANNVSARRKIAFVHTDLRAAGYNRKTEKGFYEGYNEIYFGSVASKDVFTALFPEYIDKTKLLYVKIDENSIRHAAMETPEVPMREGAINIATVGRLSHEKGVGKIPGLIKRLVDDSLDVQWYVIGDGLEKEAVQKRAEALGVGERLQVTGTLKNPFSIVARCDIYVQPSNYEGYCIALAEARTLCLPCVCCDFSGAREQIQDGVNGYITGMDEEMLYPRIKELAEQKELRESFVKKAACRELVSDDAAFWKSLYDAGVTDETAVETK